MALPNENWGWDASMDYPDDTAVTTNADPEAGATPTAAPPESPTWAARGEPPRAAIQQSDQQPSWLSAETPPAAPRWNRQAPPAVSQADARREREGAGFAAKPPAGVTPVEKFDKQPALQSYDYPSWAPGAGTEPKYKGGIPDNVMYEVHKATAGAEPIPESTRGDEFHIPQAQGMKHQGAEEIRQSTADLPGAVQSSVAKWAQPKEEPGMFETAKNVPERLAYGAAEAFNMGTAEAGHHLGNISDMLFNIGANILVPDQMKELGLDKKAFKSGVFDNMTKFFENNADYWKKRHEAVGKDAISDFFAEAVGGAVPGIAEFAAGVPFAVLSGASDAYMKGGDWKDVLYEGTVGGARRFVLGKLMHALDGFSRLGRTLGMGAIMGGETALETGGDLEKTAKSFGTGLLYGAFSKGRDKEPPSLDGAPPPAEAPPENIPTPEKLAEMQGKEKPDQWDILAAELLKNDDVREGMWAALEQDKEAQKASNKAYAPPEPDKLLQMFAEQVQKAQELNKGVADKQEADAKNIMLKQFLDMWNKAQPDDKKPPDDGDAGGGVVEPKKPEPKGPEPAPKGAAVQAPEIDWKAEAEKQGVEFRGYINDKDEKPFALDVYDPEHGGNINLLLSDNPTPEMLAEKIASKRAEFKAGGKEKEGEQDLSPAELKRFTELTREGKSVKEAGDIVISERKPAEEAPKKEEPKSEINASGESAASLEAIRRLESEKKKGASRYKIDLRSGKAIPMPTVDAVDTPAQPYEAIIKLNKDGTHEIIESGDKSKPLMGKLDGIVSKLNKAREVEEEPKPEEKPAAEKPKKPTPLKKTKEEDKGRRTPEEDLFDAVRGAEYDPAKYPQELEDHERVANRVSEIHSDILNSEKGRRWMTPDGRWEGTKTGVPEWAQNIKLTRKDRTTGKEYEEAASREDITNAINTFLNSKRTLTPHQKIIVDEVLSQARRDVDSDIAKEKEDAALKAKQEADAKKKEVPAALLKAGDKVIIDGKEHDVTVDPDDPESFIIDGKSYDAVQSKVKIDDGEWGVISEAKKTPEGAPPEIPVREDGESKADFQARQQAYEDGQKAAAPAEKQEAEPLKLEQETQAQYEERMAKWRKDQLAKKKAAEGVPQKDVDFGLFDQLKNEDKKRPTILGQIDRGKKAEAEQPKTLEEKKAQDKGAERKAKAENLGVAFVNEQQRYITDAREITKGKHKGRYEVTLTDGTKKIVDADAIKRQPKPPDEPGAASIIAPKKQPETTVEEKIKKVFGENKVEKGTIEYTDAKREGYIITLDNGKRIAIDTDLDQIVFDLEQVAKDWQMKPEKIVSATGKYHEGVIQLVKDFDEGTLSHEKFHALFDLVYTAKEKADILKKYGTEERAAEAFRRKEGFTRGTWDKIKAFVEQIRDYVQNIVGPKAPTFYSQLENIVKKADLPKKAQSIIPFLKKNQVKGAELRWMGVEQWLKENTAPDGTIDRDKLAKFAEENRVEIKEVEKGVPSKENIDLKEMLIRNGALNDYDDADLDEFVDDAKRGFYGEFPWDYVDSGYDEKALISEIVNKKTPTKYEQYVVPGGKNYRELLLTLPVTTRENLGGASDDINRYLPDDKKEPRINFYSKHWDEPNVLAHIRFDERTDADGKKVLFIQEVQSDWGQKGEKTGYKTGKYKLENYATFGAREGMTEKEVKDTWRTDDPRYLKWEANQEAGTKEISAVPPMPFPDTWHELAMKRMLRYAAENGYDRVAWTTGEQQAERYDLSKQVDEINVVPRTDAVSGEKTREVGLTMKQGFPSYITMGINKDGVVDNATQANLQGKKLEDVIGKELAKKVMSDDRQKISGVDLKVGGEGMKAFYDQLIPGFMKKYVKQWGANVGETDIGFRTPWLGKKSIKEVAQELYGTDDVWSLTEEQSVQVNKIFEKTSRPIIPVPSVDITPAMRNDVVTKGQPAFNVEEASSMPDIAKDKIATVKDFIGRIKESVGYARNLGEGMNRLISSNKADEIRAVQLYDKITKEFPLSKEDMEKVLHYAKWLEVGKPRGLEETLTPELQSYYEEHIKPLQDAVREVYDKIKENDINVEMPGHVTGYVSGKGGPFERAWTGIKNILGGGILSQSAGIMKGRTIKVLTDAQGNRQVVSIRGGKVTALSNEGENTTPLGTVKREEPKSVTEFYDRVVMEKLVKLADDLGIKHERVVKGMPAGVAGLSYTGLGRIKTRAATPESVMLHEIGHQLHERYSELDDMLKDTKLKEEMRALADLRYEGIPEDKVSGYFKKYVRKGEEKVAVMFEAYLQTPEKFKDVAPATYKRFTDFLGSHEETKPILDIKASLVLGSGKVGEAKPVRDEFIDKSGKKWKIADPTIKEAEAASGLSYHKNILLNELVSLNKLSQVSRAIDFLNNVKADPEFAKIGVKIGAADVPKGWKQSEAPQFRGYMLDPRAADSIDRFYKKSILNPGDPLSFLTGINSVIRNAIFFNPLIHTPNIANHWAVNRGTVKWFIPKEYVTLLKTSAKAIDAVIHQNEDYMNMLDHNANLLYYDVSGKRLSDVIHDSMIRELQENHPLQEHIVKTLDFVTGARFVKWLYGASSKITWATNDVATMQAVYEEMAHGKTMDDAVAETIKHIPDYRIPGRVIDSKVLSSIMTNGNLTMFSAYHYGALKSYGEMAKSMLGDVPLKERAATADKLLMLGLATMVIYPALDELAKKLSGDKNATVRRAGASTVPYNTARLVAGKMPITDYIFSILTPSPLIKMGTEFSLNRDVRTGKRLFTETKPAMDTITDEMMKSVSPLSYYQRLQTETMSPGQFGRSMLGITSPKSKNFSDAEQTAYNIFMDKQNQLPSTPHGKAVSKLYQDMQTAEKGVPQSIIDAYKNREISMREYRNIVKSKNVTYAERVVHHGSAEEAIKVYEQATPEERSKLNKFMNLKRINFINSGDMTNAVKLAKIITANNAYRSPSSQTVQNAKPKTYDDFVNEYTDVLINKNSAGMSTLWQSVMDYNKKEARKMVNGNPVSWKKIREAAQARYKEKTGNNPQANAELQ